jgi:sugar lactone lactonase YvrE
MLFVAAALVAVSCSSPTPEPPTPGPPTAEPSGPNAAPNPYRTVEGWAKLPEGRVWGSSSAGAAARDGHIWVGERCGANTCAGSSLPPVLEFDAAGMLVRSFGAGLFIFPHGMHVDHEGNIWMTDAQGQGSTGHQVFKFSRDGKVLLTLGRAGVAGGGIDAFTQPSDVAVAPSGDIFVADGHDEDVGTHRIVKFSSHGAFIREWGGRGSEPGKFLVPHALAFDSSGRLFVADRANNRIQIFDQEGGFIDQWTQFGRPSGLDIDRNDVLYVADSESDSKVNPGWTRGIRIGSATTGKVTAFIPDPEPNPDQVITSGAEGVAADPQGNVYGAEVGPRALKKYVK